MRQSRRTFLLKMRDAQQKWIGQCGGSLSGYIERYGHKDDPEKYGEGGHAIFLADINELRRIEELLNA
jgi:hypothetical protein